MKKILLIIITLTFCNCLLAQNKVDDLVQKYSENEPVIYTTLGELTLSPYIEKNSDGKPHSITLGGQIGHNQNANIIAEFFLNLFKEKNKEGYKTVGQNHEAWLYHLNNTTVDMLAERIKPEYVEHRNYNVELQKGNILFKAGTYETNAFYNTRTKRYYKDGDTVDMHNNVEHKFIHFFIKMIDKSRLGGSKSTKFKF